MNKNIRVVFGLFLFLGCFLNIGIVKATVGGPTYINNFKYNPKDESVYYRQYDNNGRGCPPILMKISLVDSKTQNVYSCEQGENVLNAYRNDNYSLGLSKILNEIDNLVLGFKDLNPINLKRNNITIDLQFVKSEKFTEGEEVKNSIFNAIIYQNGKKVMEIPISGCNIEQPFTFAGYAIPGFDKKIIILMSTKGNCFEGGYINESLLVVGDLNNLEKNYLNFYKGNEPLIPNEGTLTLYANSTTQNSITSEKSEPVAKDTESSNNIPKNKFDISVLYKVLFVVILLFFGFFVGRITKK